MNQRRRLIQYTLLLIVIILASGAFASQQAGYASPSIQVDSPAGHSQFFSPADSFQSAPVYDSGWEVLGVRPDPLPVVFTHNLGGDTDDYVVHLTCKDDTSLETYNCTDTALNVNAHWYALTNSTVTVWVGNTRPDEIRVRIYLISADYDSGWEALLVRPDPIPVQFTHNQLRNLNWLIVYLECKDDTTLGTYDCTDQAFNNNAGWYDLNGATVNAWVAAGSRPDEVRIRLFSVSPDYDSGWQTIGIRPDPLPIVLNHALGGIPDDYFVDLECRDNTELETYGCTNFSFNKQANWYGLTDTNITVWVTGGSVPDEVRVRILTPKKVYLPMVMQELCP